MIKYRSITPAVVDAADKKPGYSDLLYFCKQADVLTWANTLSDGTAGATKRIIGNHTWDTNMGVYSIQAKAKSAGATSSTQGNPGESVISYQPKFIIKGDSAQITELIESMLNDDLVFWMNVPDCGVTKLVQYGSKCTPANITAVPFNTGDRGAGGVKQWEVTIDSPDKFFYEGALTMANENDQLDTPANLAISLVEDDRFTIDFDTVENADSYDVQISTTPLFTLGSATIDLGSVTVIPFIQILLDPETIYYVRARAVGAGYQTSEWTVAVAEQTEAA